jgi:hypothetical protein
MATVYKYNVECVSAFCSFSNDTIKQIIEKALIEWEDSFTGLKLESIKVINK